MLIGPQVRSALPGLRGMSISAQKRNYLPAPCARFLPHPLYLPFAVQKARPASGPFADGEGVGVGVSPYQGLG